MNASPTISFLRILPFRYRRYSDTMHGGILSVSLLDEDKMFSKKMEIFKFQSVSQS